MADEDAAGAIEAADAEDDEDPSSLLERMIVSANDDADDAEDSA